ncbi:hypothetical protein ADUPG1_010818 [Aduncisulcus paluster]|uniref:Uncharacterized protein n=1 Tax=Aduncisulcus paluster TaxID=2918883 RepID=A0ABQ5JY41_9EUKA|nr:hypothetical protein ADUPG1_010818 [Aduncisulcus paluster]
MDSVHSLLSSSKNPDKLESPVQTRETVLREEHRTLSPPATQFPSLTSPPTNAWEDRWALPSRKRSKSALDTKHRRFANSLRVAAAIAGDDIIETVMKPTPKIHLASFYASPSRHQVIPRPKSHQARVDERKRRERMQARPYPDKLESPVQTRETVLREEHRTLSPPATQFPSLTSPPTNAWEDRWALPSRKRSKSALDTKHRRFANSLRVAAAIAGDDIIETVMKPTPKIHLASFYASPSRHQVIPRPKSHQARVDERKRRERMQARLHPDKLKRSFTKPELYHRPSSPADDSAPLQDNSLDGFPPEETLEDVEDDLLRMIQAERSSGMRNSLLVSPSAMSGSGVPFAPPSSSYIQKTINSRPSTRQRIGSRRSRIHSANPTHRSSAMPSTPTSIQGRRAMSSMSLRRPRDTDMPRTPYSRQLSASTSFGSRPASHYHKSPYSSTPSTHHHRLQTPGTQRTDRFGKPPSTALSTMRLSKTSRASYLRRCKSEIGTKGRMADYVRELKKRKTLSDATIVSFQPKSDPVVPVDPETLSHIVSASAGRFSPSQEMKAFTRVRQKEFSLPSVMSEEFEKASRLMDAVTSSLKYDEMLLTGQNRMAEYE